MIKLPKDVTIYHGGGRYKGEVPDRLSHLVPGNQDKQAPTKKDKTVKKEGDEAG